jgi:hypothetical protein
LEQQAKTKKQKTLLLRGHLAALGGDSRAVIIIIIIFLWQIFPAHPWAKLLPRALPGNQNLLWVAPSIVQKIELSRDQMTTCPTLEKKASIKST